jgi:hypothetical protein
MLLVVTSFCAQEVVEVRLEISEFDETSAGSITERLLLLFRCLAPKIFQELF